MKFSEPQPYKPYTVCMSVLIQTCELNFNPQIISQAIYLPISVGATSPPLRYRNLTAGGLAHSLCFDLQVSQANTI